ncbi:MAG: hypothetical protein LCH81_08755 [Bacteroidetes bacterium]|nr:hypothetical protein [Bacteroidota bacterium]
MRYASASPKGTWDFADQADEVDFCGLAATFLIFCVFYSYNNNCTSRTRPYSIHLPPKAENQKLADRPQNPLDPLDPQNPQNPKSPLRRSRSPKIPHKIPIFVSETQALPNKSTF